MLSTQTPLKHCSKCGENKPIECFQKNSSQKDGLQTYCKICLNLANSKSRAKHIETVRARRKLEDALRRLTQPEKVKQKQKKWYDSNGREYHQQYRRAHADLISERKRDRRKMHPYKVQHEGNVARLIREGKSPIHTFEQWMEVLQQNNFACASCKVETKIEIDHIVPLSKGGDDSIENIQPLCRKCNASKGAKTTKY